MTCRKTELNCLFAFAESILENRKEIENGDIKIRVDTVPVGESSGRRIISFGKKILGNNLKEINIILDNLERYQGIFV